MPVKGSLQPHRVSAYTRVCVSQQPKQWAAIKYREEGGGWLFGTRRVDTDSGAVCFVVSPNQRTSKAQKKTQL